MRTKKAFTLIELLVVIAIIGILAAAVIFGVSSARDKAAASRAKSDCTSFITAAQAVYADTGTATAIPGCSAANMVTAGMDEYIPQGLTSPSGCTAAYACGGSVDVPTFSATCGGVAVTGGPGGCKP